MSDIKEYKCPTCGAPLKYNIDTQKMVCSFCSNVYDLEYISANFNKNENKKPEDFDWTKYTQNSQKNVKTQRFVEYTCPSCGGSFITLNSIVNEKCPFCKHDLIISAHFTGVIRPDKIIPFSKTIKDFTDEYWKNVSMYPIIPEEFKNKKIEKRITGQYLPIWLYSCSCQAKRYDSSTIEFKLKDYPILGTNSFKKTVFYEIEPFNYDEAIDFTESCFMGFYASKYTIEAEKAMQQADSLISAYAFWNNNYDENIQDFRSLVKNNCTISDRKVLYYLVPVWTLEIKCRSKIYNFAMNGQTGEFFAISHRETVKKECQPDSPDKNNNKFKKTLLKFKNNPLKFKLLFFGGIIVIPIVVIYAFKWYIFFEKRYPDIAGPLFVLLFFSSVWKIFDVIGNDKLNKMFNPPKKEPPKKNKTPQPKPKKRTIPNFVCGEKNTMPASDKIDNKPAE